MPTGMVKRQPLISPLDIFLYLSMRKFAVVSIITPTFSIVPAKLLLHTLLSDWRKAVHRCQWVPMTQWKPICPIHTQECIDRTLIVIQIEPRCTACKRIFTRMLNVLNFCIFSFPIWQSLIHNHALRGLVDMLVFFFCW